MEKGKKAEYANSVRNKLKKVLDDNPEEQAEESEQSDDSMKTTSTKMTKSVRSLKIGNEVHNNVSEQDYKVFVSAIKAWIKADNAIAALANQKNEIQAKIKEFEAIKKEYDPIMLKYFVDSGKESVPIADGSNVRIVKKKQLEGFNAKNIPKYIEMVMTAVTQNDTEFIENELLGMHEPKLCPDLDWSKYPKTAERFIERYTSDTKFAACVAVLYASKVRRAEETDCIKRTTA